MTRFIQTLFFIFISTLITYGQTEQQTIPVVAYWQKGDVYKYRITKLDQRWQDGELSKDDSTSYIVRMEILDSTATSYRIKWTYEGNVLASGIPEEFLKKFSKYNTTDIIYRTDELGAFVEIENWKEFSKMTKSLFSEIIDYLGDDKAAKAKLQKAMKPMTSALSSRQGVEQVLFKELQFFHFLYGVEFEVDEPFEYEELIPNLFDKKPIRGEAKIEVKSVDFDNSFCTIERTLKINPQDMRQLMETVFSNITINNKDKYKDFEEFLESTVFDINDKNQYELYFYPGVPTFIKTQRVVDIKMEGKVAKRIDTIKIELIID